MIERAREAVGPDFKLLVDANQGFYWGMFPGGAPRWDLRTALDFTRALDGLDIHWLEEPLDRHDYAGHAELRRHSGVRLAGGELSWRLAEYREMATRGCLDVLDRLAGRGRRARRAHGLGYAPHCWSNGFSLIANLHVMAASTNCDLCEFPLRAAGSGARVARRRCSPSRCELDADGCAAAAGAGAPARYRRGCSEVRREDLRQSSLEWRALS